MTEVEKLYSLAGVEKIYIECPADYYGYKCGKSNWDDADCPCDEEAYPLFTAEKQIAIIKWLADKANCLDICYDKYKGVFGMQIGTKYSGISYSNDFAELLASRVNNIWSDLYPKDIEQIREILK